MSQEDIQNIYGFAIIYEVNKMKSISIHIKDEIKQEKINRLKLKELLFDLSTVIQSIMIYLKVSSPNLEEKNIFGSTRESVLKEYSQLDEKLLTFAQQIDDEKLFPVQKLQNGIFLLLRGITLEVNSFETYMLLHNEAINPFSKIMQFISTKPMGLDEKWLAAACHLSAFDIMINKKREQLKIAKTPEDEKKIDFYKKFDEVIQKLESKKGEMSKIVTQLPKVFWQIRVQVIHYGYVPSQEELDLIINWSNGIMKVISEEQK